MCKFTWKDMEHLHEKLMEFPSYKNNGLRIIPGGDGKTILVIKGVRINIDDDNFVGIPEVIEELNNYDELAGFLCGVAWSYYNGVKSDD